jgi:hypothetical protein
MRMVTRMQLGGLSVEPSQLVLNLADYPIQNRMHTD